MSKVKDRIQIRRDSASNWIRYNPILASGEYGLETDTFLIKIGNGITAWNNLRYLNKLDSNYFTEENGEITFNEAFETLLDSFIQKGSTIEQLFITNTPTLPQEAANKQYVDEAIASIGTLTRRVVNTLPQANDAQENIIYLIKRNNVYVEYMLIDNKMEQIGTGSTIIPVATASEIGGVKSSPEIGVTQDGFMTIKKVSTSSLYVPDGDTFTIRSGNAT